MLQTSFIPSDAFSVFWGVALLRMVLCQILHLILSKSFLAGLSYEALSVSEFISEDDKKKQKV